MSNLFREAHCWDCDRRTVQRRDTIWTTVVLVAFWALWIFCGFVSVVRVLDSAQIAHAIAPENQSIFLDLVAVIFVAIVIGTPIAVTLVTQHYQSRQPWWCCKCGLVVRDQEPRRRDD